LVGIQNPKLIFLFGNAYDFTSSSREVSKIKKPIIDFPIWKKALSLKV
jgi:hypothetical protein